MATTTKFFTNGKEYTVTVPDIPVAATLAELQAGTLTTKWVNPAVYRQYLDPLLAAINAKLIAATTGVQGFVTLATDAEALAVIP